MVLIPCFAFGQTKEYLRDIEVSDEMKTASVSEIEAFKQKPPGEISSVLAGCMCDPVLFKTKEEYEATVIAPGFDSFVATQPSKQFFTESSLKAKNILMAAEWNTRYRNPRQYDAKIYEAAVDYDQNTEYGLDVEYTLYMFFRFMEKEHNMSLTGDKLTAQR